MMTEINIILVLCASSGQHMKEGYTRLLVNKLKMVDQLRILHDKLIDFSSILVNISKKVPQVFVQNQTRIAYRSPYPAPCHKEMP